jgi:hypothetical protein
MYSDGDKLKNTKSVLSDYDDEAEHVRSRDDATATNYTRAAARVLAILPRHVGPGPPGPRFPHRDNQGFARG